MPKYTLKDWKLFQNMVCDDMSTSFVAEIYHLWDILDNARGKKSTLPKIRACIISMSEISGWYRLLEKYAYRTAPDDLLLYVNGDPDVGFYYGNRLLSVMLDFLSFLDYLDAVGAPQCIFYDIVAGMTMDAGTMQEVSQDYRSAITLSESDFWESYDKGTTPIRKVTMQLKDSCQYSDLDRITRFASLLFEGQCGDLLPYIDDQDLTVRGIARWRLEHGK
jgi:hypothetical protein